MAQSQAMSDEFEPPEQPKGFLTETDRAFLAGETDLDPENPSDKAKMRRRRQLIRQRIEGALWDFSHLYSLTGLHETETVFKAFSGEGGELSSVEEGGDLFECVRSLQALLFFALSESEPEAAFYSTTVKWGVEQLLEDLGYEEGVYYDTKADFSFNEFGKVSISELKDRFYNGPLLGFWPINLLWRKGEITTAERDSYMARLSFEQFAKLDIIDRNPNIPHLTNPANIDLDSVSEDEIRDLREYYEEMG